jgi:hypothetical protein
MILSLSTSRVENWLAEQLAPITTELAFDLIVSNSPGTSSLPSRQDCIVHGN